MDSSGSESTYSGTEGCVPMAGCCWVVVGKDTDEDSSFGPPPGSSSEGWSSRIEGATMSQLSCSRRYPSYIVCFPCNVKKQPVCSLLLIRELVGISCPFSPRYRSMSSMAGKVEVLHSMRRRIDSIFWRDPTVCLRSACKVNVFVWLG